MKPRPPATHGPRNPLPPARIPSNGAELPQDREARFLIGLSAEVNAACTTWLNTRGIRMRTWRPPATSRSGLNRLAQGDFHDPFA